MAFLCCLCHDLCCLYDGLALVMVLLCVACLCCLCHDLCCLCDGLACVMVLRCVAYLYYSCHDLCYLRDGRDAWLVCVAYVMVLRRVSASIKCALSRARVRAHSFSPHRSPPTSSLPSPRPLTHFCPFFLTVRALSLCGCSGCR